MHTVGYRFLCDVQVIADVAGVATENDPEGAVDSDHTAGAVQKEKTVAANSDSRIFSIAPLNNPHFFQVFRMN